jgi:serine/threonine protein kinase
MGIIHWDIKLENIMVIYFNEREIHIKMIDFGSAIDTN